MRDPIEKYNQLRAAGHQEEVMLLAYANDVGPELECIKYAGQVAQLVYHLGKMGTPILMMKDGEGFDWNTPGGGYA